jgi:hypothetical protein
MGELEAGPLPDYLPELTLEENLPRRVQEGWTLVNFGTTSGLALAGTILDELGRIRWYHRRSGGSGGANELGITSDGVLLGGHRGLRSAIVSWQGDLVWEADFANHHDIRTIGDDDHLLYVSTSNGCPGINGDRVRIYNRGSDRLDFDWDLCEHYRPVPEVRDWSHMNTAIPFPDEPAILLSSRNQSTLFKVSLENGEIEWILGTPPGTFEPDDIPIFEILGGERFWQQHSPEVEANGNILLFDNGHPDLRPFSRVIELELDEEAMEARVIWEFRPDPDVYMGQWGDADRLANGNVLTAWGERSRTEPSYLIEVSPGGDVLWQLVIELGFGVYRADRLGALPLMEDLLQGE